MLSDRPDDVEPSPGESLESVPWMSLETPSTLDRRWLAAGVVVVLAALGMSAARVLLAPPPVVPVTTTLVTQESTPMSPTTVVVPLAPTVPAMTTDVDVLALDQGSLERLVVETAAWAVAEFFAADTSGFWAGEDIRPAGPVFVERVASLHVERLAPDRWWVETAVSLWDGSESGAFERRPPAAVGIEIGLDAIGVAHPIGNPSPVGVEFGPVHRPGLAVDDPDPAVVEAALEVVRERGWAVAPEPPAVRAVEDGSFRVVVGAVDDHGGVWPLEVRIGPDGSPSGPG